MKQFLQLSIATLFCSALVNGDADILLQPGAPAACSLWVAATPGDSCWSISQRYGIDINTFIANNPQLYGDCTHNMLAGYSYCVVPAPYPGSPPPTTPTYPLPAECAASMGNSCVQLIFEDGATDRVQGTHSQADWCQFFLHGPKRYDVSVDGILATYPGFPQVGEAYSRCDNPVAEPAASALTTGCSCYLANQYGPTAVAFLNK